MSEEVQINTLKYGQIITISRFEDIKSFVTSDGHAKNSVFLKNFSKQNNKSSQNSKYQNIVINKDDFSNCLFQIYPKVQNSTKTKILRESEQFKQQKKKTQSNELTVKQKNTQKDGPPLNSDENTNNQFLKKIPLYQSQLYTEFKSNVDEFNNMMEISLSYNEPFQLLHLNSSKFLACQIIESKYEKENYKILLDDFSSEQTLFKIIPAFAYQKESATYIYENECIKIVKAQNFNNKTINLHFSEEICQMKQKNQLQQQTQIMSQLTKQPQQIFQKSTSQNINREVNGCLEKAAMLKVQIFQDLTDLQNQKYLKCGDAIWLHHSQMNCTLAAQQLRIATTKEQLTSLNIIVNIYIAIFIQNLKGMDVKKQFKIHIIQAGQNVSFEDYSGNTFGLWIIENQDFQKGGCVEYRTAYRLKHMSSGCYLSVMDENKNKREEIQKDQELKNQNVNEQFVETGSFLFIRNINSGMWLDIVNLDQNINQQNEENESNFNKALKASFKMQMAENQVFKVFQISSNKMWEAKFVISCSHVLLKFLLSFRNSQNNNDEQNLNVLKQKIKTAKYTINNLNNFCNNKLLNYQPDQKYGMQNSRRQKLLKEQYYIDFLIKILEDLLPKNELELWIQYKNQEDEEKRQMQNEQNHDFSDNQQIFAIQQKQNKPKIQNIQLNNEYMLYFNEKVQLAIDIYSLLVSICKNNPENQLYTFDLIPYFYIHCKYIPEAIDCVISLISNNETILNKLSDNLKIPYEYEKSSYNDQINQKQIKILINLYDQDNNNTNNNGELISFKQHEKITPKPINIIIYFMNLIWDDKAQYKSHYLKFLRSICRIQNKAISLNQENIFKLFKKYSKVKQQIRYDQYFKTGAVKLPDPNSTEQEIKQYERNVSEQIRFFSELSFGRNFLWCKELIPHFSNHYLLENIWSQGELNNFSELRACFCQLAMSLYIDHDPLQRKPIPNYCRLFNEIDVADDVEVFKSENNQENEILMYKQFIIKLLSYLQNFSDKIEDKIKEYQIEDHKMHQLKYENMMKENSFIDDTLLLNSIELTHLILNLGLFEALKETNQFKFLVKYLMNIFIFDAKNIQYIAACQITLNRENDRRKNIKDQKKVLLNFDIAANMKKLQQAANQTTLLLKQSNSEKETKEDDDINFDPGQGDNQNPLEQSKLYDNHIMRGQIKLNNMLQEMNYQDQAQMQTEINVKLKILDILENIQNLRQNYLISNVLKFFKDNIADIVISSNDKARQNIQEILRKNIKSILPNIAKTGIDVVDQMFDQKDSSSLLNSLSIKSLNPKNIKKYDSKNKFHQYIKTQGYLHYRNLDELISSAIENSEEYEDPIATCLPQLITSFLLIYDEQLEKRTLKLLIKMYNQRYELIQNINKMQIIFDQYTFQLFEILKKV
ncbi:MIR domain protein [Ichthyophthirius multifiliis]|uniref:MIR domain protein n=1 Tax=Ichthyophthirius multifiliis TaxID=5932 RepID=G0QPV9_ICHMU|nr:MIR domain protein [Ichthyophthirius multifiliis]EGR32737.1 MIR domain protein [Ichthyophthirius multifiliis]|eukprot:XP_004036723.1 MIR domain protein [Ichthyophthirius multifiliis]